MSTHSFENTSCMWALGAIAQPTTTMNGVTTTMQLPVTVASGVSFRSKVVYGGMLEFYCLFTFRVENMVHTVFLAVLAEFNCSRIAVV